MEAAGFTENVIHYLENNSARWQDNSAYSDNSAPWTAEHASALNRLLQSNLHEQHEDGDTGYAA